MFPLAISSCFSPSKFPDVGTAQTHGPCDTSVLHNVSFSAFWFWPNQNFLVGLPLWQMKEIRSCRPTVSGCDLYALLVRLRRAQTGASRQFLRRECADRFGRLPLCCVDVPTLVANCIAA